MTLMFGPTLELLPIDNLPRIPCYLFSFSATSSAAESLEQVDAPLEHPAHPYLPRRVSRYLSHPARLRRTEHIFRMH